MKAEEKVDILPNGHPNGRIEKKPSNDDTIHPGKSLYYITYI